MIPYLHDKTVSQSFLAKLDTCPHSALLYAKYREDRVQTHAQARGEAFHALAEWVVKECVRAQEGAIPPDVAREMMDTICDERIDLVIPAHERDALRGMAWNFAAETRVDLDNPPKTEMKVVAQLGEWTVQGIIDRIWELERDEYIEDYKTSLSIPSQETFDKSFQTRLYALIRSKMNPRIDTFHLAETYVRFLSKTCRACNEFNDVELEACKECGGTEFAEPRLARRKATISKRDLHDFERAIVAHLNGLANREEWPASPGSHCARCPAPADCPLPSALRPTVLTTEEQATRAAQNLDRMEAEVKELKKALRARVEEEGEVSYGDFVWGFNPVYTNRLDKDGMARAIREGGGDPDRFVKTTTSTRFQKKKQNGKVD